MNDEDRKYLKSIQKMSPSFEIFNKMVQILANVHNETDQLRTALDTALLGTSKAV